MAAIQNSGGSAAATTAPPATGGAGALAGAPAQGAAAAATDTFTQLIAEMIGASDVPSQQSVTPPLQDLSGIGPDANALEVSGDEHDSDEDGTDDADAGALAMATLLPGLSCLAPTAPASTSSADTSATPCAIEGALLATRADADMAKAATDELSSGSSDAGGHAPQTDSSTMPAAANTQNTMPSTHVHALLATHAVAHDIDASADGALSAPVGTPAWKDDLGTQLTWMAVNGREAASLRLSPEHLGPLEIRISVHDGEATVYFGATHAETRTALEQSLPRLRELFASQGLVLADAGVSRDAPRNAFKPSAPPSGPRSVSDAAAEAPVKSITLARLGLIDTYV